MENGNSKKELFASTAVFAELANENIDLAQILEQFILSTYSLQKTLVQTSSDISEALNKHFRFKVPDAIIKSVLRRLTKNNSVSLSDGRYRITDSERDKWRPFLSKVDEKEGRHQVIIDKLRGFVSVQRGKLSDDDKKELNKSLTNYLFDESYEDSFTDLVSAFIIKNSADPQFPKELNLIREGITLIKGINYTPDINTIPGWRKPLTLYLDVEHLFSFYGYNGEVYKRLIDDLIELITQINQNHRKKHNERAINLMYLETTEKDIKRYFFSARKIVSGEWNPENNSIAMYSILNGCSKTSDVISKESEFFRYLSDHKIFKADAVDIVENSPFNVGSQEILEKYSDEEHPEKEITSILSSFTAINVFRKGRNNRQFEDIEHILITGSRVKLLMCKDPEVKPKPGDFSFASHINYATQRIWFRLNRGLGFKAELPTSLDVVAKAQMLLSGQLNESVRDRYNKLNEAVESGTRTVESVQEYYLNLRSNVAKPEDIQPENVDEKVKFLFDSEDVERFQEEQSILKSKAKAYEELKKKEEEEIVKQENDKRNATLTDCGILQKRARKKYKVYVGLYYMGLLALALILGCGLRAIIGPQDTILDLLSFLSGLIPSVFGLFKATKAKAWLSNKAHQEFEDFKLLHNISQEDLDS